MRPWFALALALASAPALAQQPAQRSAQQPAAAMRVEVIVIEAGVGDGGVAPALQSIPQLRQPPFNAFTQMSVTARNTIPLATTGASTPGGGVTVALAAPSPEGRVTLNVSIGGSGSVQFVAGPGEPFFTVRAGRNGRATIYGFIVRR